MVAAIQTSGLAGAGFSGTHAATSPLAGRPGMKAPTTAGSPFAQLVTDAVRDANALEDQAHQAVDGLLTGSGVDVHQAMIASEKASMAFEMALAFRNKAIQSYQTVMNLQF